MSTEGPFWRWDCWVCGKVEETKYKNEEPSGWYVNGMLKWDGHPGGLCTIGTVCSKECFKVRLDILIDRHFI